MKLDFNNTEVAFTGKSDRDLRESWWLFKIIAEPWVVRIGSVLTNIALAIRFPVSWLIKPTIFKHFCGGETVAESRETVAHLAKGKVKSILDFSSEGKETDQDFDRCKAEIISVIEESRKNKNIAFAVFKPTGLSSLQLLEDVSTALSSGVELSSGLKADFDKVKRRYHEICQASFNANLPIFIDAEETWTQLAVDVMVTDLMKEFNKEKPIVYNTLQLYRTDRLDFLKQCLEDAIKEKYYIGVKLVRGAYMEKERERALKMGYPSPINKDKASTDEMFNNTLRFCMDHLDRISFCCASHNEESAMLVTRLMSEKGISPDDPRIYFSQLLGMSDHISFNLAAAGYHVSKYVPYGPVRDVLPYLIRRAQENTSVKGQTGRELNLISRERIRRKKLS